MDHRPEHLPTTEAAVTALGALAAHYPREIEVTHDIGADQTSRRSTAGIGVTTDPDGSLPYEAYVEFARLCPEDDTLITAWSSRCPATARTSPMALLSPWLSSRAG